MRSIYICIGHDNHFIIPQIVQIKAGAQPHPQRLGKIVNLLVCANFIAGGPQNIQNFTAQWQQGLGFAVAGHFGRSAGAVPFDQEQLGAGPVGRRTIHQLAR